MLLEAEKAAAETIREATEYRNKLLKQAREEAQKEIAEFKSQKEEEFKNHCEQWLLGQPSTPPSITTTTTTTTSFD